MWTRVVTGMGLMLLGGQVLDVEKLADSVWREVQEHSIEKFARWVAQVFDVAEARKDSCPRRVHLQPGYPRKGERVCGDALCVERETVRAAPRSQTRWEERGGRRVVHCGVEVPLGRRGGDKVVVEVAAVFIVVPPSTMTPVPEPLHFEQRVS